MLLVMDELRTFGNWMKEARLRAGLTQEELAERAEFDDSYINKVEKGGVSIASVSVGFLSFARRQLSFIRTDSRG